MKNVLLAALVMCTTALLFGCQPESTNDVSETTDSTNDAPETTEPPSDAAENHEGHDHTAAEEGDGHDTDAPAADTAVASTAAPALLAALDNQTVEAGCGSCIYKLEGGEGCYLAIKVGNKAYPVEGTDVDAHEAGLCSAVQSAVVTGKMHGDGSILASEFKFAKAE